jgi:S1-C subfamily serine protease
MKAFMRFAVVAALLALAVPAFAGQPTGKDGYTAQQCLDEFAKMRDRGWAGYDALPNDKGEWVISSVPANGPGVAAGFQVGDVIVAANGAKVSDKSAWKKATKEWKIGSPVTFTVNRGGTEQQIAVTLAPMPEDVFLSMVGNHMIHDHMAPAATMKAEAKTETETAPAK